MIEILSQRADAAETTCFGAHQAIKARDVSALICILVIVFFFFQAEDGIRDSSVTGVQTCALPISSLPVGLGGKGNEGVAATVGQTPGSIGYVELAYADKNKLAYGALQNRGGKLDRKSVV